MWNCNVHVSVDADFALGYLQHAVLMTHQRSMQSLQGWRRVSDCHYYVPGIMENRVKSPNVTFKKIKEKTPLLL
jgi:hypothetical protein